MTDASTGKGLNVTALITTILEILGYALIVVGVDLIFWPAALIVAGLGLLAFSYTFSKAR